MSNQKKTKKQIIKEYKQKLKENPLWAVQGCLAIYKYQTPLEQESGMTTDDNGAGFTGCDAEILTSFAKQIQIFRNARGASRFLTPLSIKQMDLLHKKMPKYASQLLRIVEQNNS